VPYDFFYGLFFTAFFYDFKCTFRLRNETAKNQIKLFWTMSLKASYQYCLFCTEYLTFFFFATCSFLQQNLKFNYKTHI